MSNVAWTGPSSLATGQLGHRDAGRHFHGAGDGTLRALELVAAAAVNAGREGQPLHTASLRVKKRSTSPAPAPLQLMWRLAR